MTTSQDLLGLSYAALVPAAAGNVAKLATPSDWPVQADQYPIWKLRLLGEEKQSLGRGGLNFVVTATIRISAEISEPAQVGDLGATQAEITLWEHVRRIERTVINSYPLTSLIQQFVSIRTQLAYSSEAATHLAGAQIDIAMEFYQGADDFAPLDIDPLLELHATDPWHPGAGFVASPPQ